MRKSTTGTRFRFIISHLMIFYYIAFCLLTIGACSTKSPISSDSRQVSIKKDSPVFFLKPILDYKTIDDDIAIDASSYHGEEVLNYIQEITTEILHQKSIEVVYSPPSERSSAKQNQNVINPTGTNANKQIIDLKKQINHSDKGTKILHMKLEVYVGPKGSWNPMSGAITSGMSRTVIRGKLLDAGTNRPVWKNSVQIRDIPKIDDPNFREAIELLFSTIK